MLASSADIVCLQKTQKAYIMKPEDFQVQVKNYLGHRQLIIVRKVLSTKRWMYQDVPLIICLHLVSVEIL